MIRNLVVFFCFGALLATSATAYDENLVPRVRQLGIAVGKAYVCAPVEDRAYARADFEEMFDTILDIDGHELAFVFAVGIGYGAASDKTGLDCAKLIERVNAVKAAMGLGGAK
jgi:phosphotransferase system  glucose/maltose/N-acetylglucosamine-specific IIC component